MRAWFCHVPRRGRHAVPGPEAERRSAPVNATPRLRNGSLECHLDAAEGTIRGRASAFLFRQGGGEETGEQLGDALGLVVMHPVGGVGQALDAVQVGYVVVVGLG